MCILYVPIYNNNLYRGIYIYIYYYNITRFGATNGENVCVLRPHTDTCCLVEPENYTLTAASRSANENAADGR